MDSVRAALAGVWGKTTTIGIAVAAAILGVMADPEYGPLIVANFPWAPRAAAEVAFGLAVLRALAPRGVAPPQKA